MKKAERAYPPMKKAYKTKWLKALRSGKYPQTRKGILCNTNNNQTPLGYCCLGCLAHACNLDQDMMDANLSDYNCDLVGLNLKAHNKLIELNDSAHYNFFKIADWIDKNL